MPAFPVSYISCHHTTTKVGDSASSAQRFAYWVAIFSCEICVHLVRDRSLPMPIYPIGKLCHCQECLMTYKTQLFPWCIIRPQSNMQQTIVARFRRRNDAEAHLQILRQLLPSAPHTIIFDITPDSPDADRKGVIS
jgi:hypothetical protein